MKHLTLILLFVLSFSALAQEYHASALWNVIGPAKEIKYSNTDYYNINPTVKFKKNGKLKYRPIILWYGENGYPVSHSWGTDKNGGTIADNIEFDTMSRPVLFGYTYTLSGINAQQELKFTYDSDSYFPSTMTRKIVVDSNGSYIEAEYKFSNYTSDEYGNWISRKASMKATGNGCLPKVESAEFIETRSIEYFKTK